MSNNLARAQAIGVQQSERELPIARAIIRSPELHEEATLRAACKLLKTVGIAEDRRNADKALAQLALRPRPAETAPDSDHAFDPEHFGADARAQAQRLHAWIIGLVVAALLLALLVAPFVLTN